MEVDESLVNDSPRYLFNKILQKKQLSNTPYPVTVVTDSRTKRKKVSASSSSILSDYTPRGLTGKVVQEKSKRPSSVFKQQNSILFKSASKSVVKKQLEKSSEISLDELLVEKKSDESRTSNSKFLAVSNKVLYIDEIFSEEEEEEENLSFLKTNAKSKKATEKSVLSDNDGCASSTRTPVTVHSSEKCNSNIKSAGMKDTRRRSYFEASGTNVSDLNHRKNVSAGDDLNKEISEKLNIYSFADSLENFDLEVSNLQAEKYGKSNSTSFKNYHYKKNYAAKSMSPVTFVKEMRPLENPSEKSTESSISGNQSEYNECNIANTTNNSIRKKHKSCDVTNLSSKHKLNSYTSNLHVFPNSVLVEKNFVAENCNATSSDNDQEFSAKKTWNVNASSSNNCQEFSSKKTRNVNAISTDNCQEVSPKRTRNVNARSRDNYQEFSPKRIRNVNATSYDNCQELSIKKTRNVNATSSNSYREFSTKKTRNVNATSSDSYQEFGTKKTRNVNAISTDNCQEFSPKRTHNVNATSNDNCQEFSFKRTRNVNATSSDYCHEFSPKRTLNINVSHRDNYREFSPKRTHNVNATSNDNCQEFSHKRTHNVNAVSSDNWQEFSSGKAHGVDELVETNHSPEIRERQSLKLPEASQLNSRISETNILTTEQNRSSTNVSNRNSASRQSTSLRKSLHNKVPRISDSQIKYMFQHFSDMPTSASALPVIHSCSDIFWEKTIDTLSTYADHGGRNNINCSDIELLLYRQGFAKDRNTLNALIEKYLPLEMQAEIIPVARAGNVVLP